MIFKDEFENRINRELNIKAGEIKPKDKMINDIIDSLGKGNVKRNLFKDFFVLDYKKIAAVSVITFLLSFGTLLGFSTSFRAMAIAAVNDIVKVFALEKSDNQYIVVEKSSLEPFLMPGYGKPTLMEDRELSDEIGFKISFPKYICEDYSLSGKFEIVTLREKVSYEQDMELKNAFISAKDDSELEALFKNYDNIKGTMGSYVSDGRVISIGAYGSELNFNENRVISEVSINTGNGSLSGYWVEVPVPQYPIVTIKGVDQQDYTQAPIKTDFTSMLLWSSNGVSYSLSSYNNSTFSLEEAIKISEAFMNQQ